VRRRGPRSEARRGDLTAINRCASLLACLAIALRAKSRRFSVPSPNGLAQLTHALRFKTALLNPPATVRENRRMSLAHSSPRLRSPDGEHALKALVRLLARQVARELLTTNPQEKEVDHEDKEDSSDATQAGASERSG
jgi:hypothetical protein